MASLNITGFDDVLHMLEKYSRKANVDAVAKRAVEAAKGKVASAMSASLALSEAGPQSTGSISGSVQPTDAKINSYGAYSVARPTGRDNKGVRNAEKAAYLEYGTYRLDPRPWRARAVNSAMGPCKKIMEGIVTRELGAK